jgi:hypothetical protein
MFRFVRLSHCESRYSDKLVRSNRVGLKVHIKVRCRQRDVINNRLELDEQDKLICGALQG